jgi:hypothetical protein
LVKIIQSHSTWKWEHWFLSSIMHMNGRMGWATLYPFCRNSNARKGVRINHILQYSFTDKWENSVHVCLFMSCYVMLRYVISMSSCIPGDWNFLSGLPELCSSHKNLRSFCWHIRALIPCLPSERRLHHNTHEVHIKTQIHSLPYKIARVKEADDGLCITEQLP